MDPRYGRYPFLRGARAAVESAEIDLADIVRADRSPAVERAVERISGAVSVGRVPDPIGDVRIEVVSYPIARVLVSLVDKPVLTDRYALAEARRAYDLFTAELREPGGLRSGSTDRITLTALLRDFDLSEAVAETDEGFEITVGAYLSLAADLRDPSWRLVNRRISGGRVPVTRTELEELIREAIRGRVAEGLPLQVPDSIAENLDDEVLAIEESLSDVSIPQDLDVVFPSVFPPCIDAILERLMAGESMSDIQQFVGISFLATIGMTADDIVTYLDVENTAMDQSVREQVRLIHGSNRSTAYPPPSCATMQLLDVCVDDPDRCESEGHPLAAYASRVHEAGDVVRDWRDDARAESSG